MTTVCLSIARVFMLINLAKVKEMQPLLLRLRQGLDKMRIRP